MPTGTLPPASKHLPPSVPLCLNCLKPYDPLSHYCPHCHAAVGQFTPNIPFINIGYQCEFWGRLWKKLWSPEPQPVFIRVMATLMILFFFPFLLLAIPFVLIHRARPQPRGFDVLPKPRGFDALIEAEQKLATSSPPSLIPDHSPHDQPPDYSDRPRNKPR